MPRSTRAGTVELPLIPATMQQMVVVGLIHGCESRHLKQNQLLIIVSLSTILYATAHEWLMYRIMVWVILENVKNENQCTGLNIVLV